MNAMTIWSTADQIPIRYLTGQNEKIRSRPVAHDIKYSIRAID